MQLNQPYPLQTYGGSIRRDLFIGGFLTVFILIFRPFGLHLYYPGHIEWIVGFGIVCLSTMLAVDTIGYKLFPGVFIESRWTVLHQIIWGIVHLSLLGLTNQLFAVYIEGITLEWEGFFRMERRVFISAVLPLTLYILFRQNHLLRVNLKNAKDISGDIVHPAAPSPTSEVLSFRGDSDRGSYEIPATDLIYIVSEDNYVGFVSRFGHETKKTLLRSTLGAVEETLSSRSEFFRCHRAFIVNLNHLETVDGNSQGYRLRLTNISESIPVARTRNAELKSAIKRHGRTSPI